MLIKNILLGAIAVYQNLIATVFGMGGACRFEPSCSEYAKDCFNNLNVIEAIFYSTKRILRCRPFGAFGEDPAPKRGNT